MTDHQKVVFIDGVGAGRSSIESCRDGVQWIMVGDRVYWPLSDADAQRLQSACCGNGSFDGPSTVVQPAASSETVNVIGMPEFDGLLDHIYEHGTAAEGVIEKANAFARAVIARYAPQQPEASTTLNEAESHARICAKLAEQHKSDPLLFAALTDAAAIIRDLLHELRREVERRWEGNRRAAQEYVEDMRDVLRDAAQVCKDLDDEALAKESRLACGAECAAAIADLAVRMNVPFERT